MNEGKQQMRIMTKWHVLERMACPWWLSDDERTNGMREFPGTTQFVC